MLNNPVSALHSIVQQYLHIDTVELSLLEGNVLQIALDALGWEMVCNKFGEIEKFKEVV